MKNNILIIVVVTLVAVAVIAAVILAGLAKKTGGPSNSDDIPNWGGSSGDISSDSSAGGDSSIDSSSENLSDNSWGESSASSVFVPDYSGKPVSSSTPTSTGSVTSSISSSGGEFSAADSIVATASSLIGVPFVMGGNNSDGFDNPGFIYYVLRENGFHNCSHNVEKQSKMGRRIEFSELKAGDLVFFYDETDTDVGFGGIYVGDGKMIACLTPTNREAGVMSADITTPYYQRKFYCGVSLS